MLDKMMRMFNELLDKRIVKAPYLAKLLSVSERTVHRYVDALGIAGVPIYSVQGRNGGIYIGEEFKIKSTAFARGEIEFLRDMTSNLSSQADIAKYEGIMAKIGSVNSPSSHNVTSNSLYIQPDPYTSNQLNSKITALQNAINNLNEVSIDYISRNDEATRRIIRPLNFVLNNNEWYVYAFCTQKLDMRIFKLSRIKNIVTKDTKFLPITNYAKKWKFAWNDGKELINMILHVESNSKYDIEEWLGMECVNVTPTGEIIANASRYLDNELAYKLLSFGTNIKVLEPKVLNDKLNTIIKSLQTNSN